MPTSRGPTSGGGDAPAAAVDGPAPPPVDHVPIGYFSYFPSSGGVGGVRGMGGGGGAEPGQQPVFESCVRPGGWPDQRSALPSWQWPLPMQGSGGGVSGPHSFGPNISLSQHGDGGGRHVAGGSDGSQAGLVGPHGWPHRASDVHGSGTGPARHGASASGSFDLNYDYINQYHASMAAAAAGMFGYPGGFGGGMGMPPYGAVHPFSSPHNVGVTVGSGSRGPSPTPRSESMATTSLMKLVSGLSDAANAVRQSMSPPAARQGGAMPETTSAQNFLVTSGTKTEPWLPPPSSYGSAFVAPTAPLMTTSMMYGSGMASRSGTPSRVGGVDGDGVAPLGGGSGMPLSLAHALANVAAAVPGAVSAGIAPPRGARPVGYPVPVVSGYGGGVASGGGSARGAVKGRRGGVGVDTDAGTAVVGAKVRRVNSSGTAPAATTAAVGGDGSGGGGGGGSACGPRGPASPKKRVTAVTVGDNGNEPSASGAGGGVAGSAVLITGANGEIDVSKPVWTRLENGKRLFTCRFCSYTSLYSATMIGHERVHQNVKPFKCAHCDYRAARRFEVTTHERIHTDERPVQCPHCPMRFRANGSRRWHIQHAHRGGAAANTAAAAAAAVVHDDDEDDEDEDGGAGQAGGVSRA